MSKHEGITRRVLGPLQVNTYIVAGTSGECLIVDPGDCTILEEIKALGCSEVLVAVTHGHFDHTQGVDCLVDAGARLAAHPREPEVAVASAGFASFFGVEAHAQRSKPAILLDDGAVISHAGLELTVYHTPGHSPDHIILYDAGRRLAFTGDLVFKGSIGRVDLPGASPSEMAASLERVKRLIDPGAILLPGHGPETTMREELEWNPFLRDSSLIL